MYCFWLSPQFVKGCQLCNCNGHGNVSQGFCDAQSGKCFCTNDTEGDQCQFCRHNYFGDAKYVKFIRNRLKLQSNLLLFRNNGICYLKCSGRVLITNVQQVSGIGLSETSRIIENIFCVWIMTTAFELLLDSSNMKFPPIKLLVDSNNFECSIDSLTIYDGIPSFVSLSDSSTTAGAQLLGSLCSFGQNKNGSSHFAQSGIMTVIYSGRSNNFSSKFSAQYSPVSCPNYCNGRWRCVNETCQCKPGLFGLNCEFGCPVGCGESCSAFITDTDCNCNNAYNCVSTSNLTIPKVVINEIVLSVSSNIQEIILPSMVADEKLNSIWIHGGFNQKLNLATGNLIKINLSDGSVTEMNATKANTAFMHSLTAAYSRKGFYSYSGYKANNNGFYFYNYLTSQWKQLKTNIDQSKNIVPVLSGHTLTMTSNSLVLIGGYSFESGFNYFVYVYSNESQTWKRLKPSGLNLPAIYGHTSVYVQTNDSIYVYGGYVFDGAGMVLSNRLYAYNVVQQIWFMIPSRRANLLFAQVNCQTMCLKEIHYKSDVFQPVAVSFAFGRVVNDYLVFVSRMDTTSLIKLPVIQTFNVKDGLWNRVQLKKINYTTFVSHDTTTTVGINWQAASSFGDRQIILLDSISWKLYVLTFPNDLCTLSSNNDCSVDNCVTCNLIDTSDVCVNQKLTKDLR